jgi:2-methylcitrate dehydratase (2-methyl-trans-aconitate forming)
VAFACTTCNGMSGALDPKIQQEIIDRDLYATAVLSGNRNFDGRIHPYAKQAFLASPPLVVAYAIAGTIRFDIEKDALGIDAAWQAGHAEGHLAVGRGNRRHRRFQRQAGAVPQVYIPMFEGEPGGGRVSPLYDWRPRAPTSAARRTGKARWPASAALTRACARWRCWATTSPPTTSRRPTPSWLDSAAGEYLAKMGLPEEDFNSYATHRGDHLTAQRATFANPTLKNEMAVVDGKVKQGSLTRIEPEGKVTRMWEAIETYMERKQPLIIIAGADYGQGSSRDWAAKGVRLAGVEAIVAEGFERIHRTNLVGMGVLPLEFKPGDTRKTYAIDGTETFDVVGERRPRADLTLVIRRKQRRARGSARDLPHRYRRGVGDLRGWRRAAAFRADFLESARSAA